MESWWIKLSLISSAESWQKEGRGRLETMLLAFKEIYKPILGKAQVVARFSLAVN